LLLSLLVALALGCRQEVPPLFRRNQPPETSLTVVPEDSAFGFYRYHVYWHGRDSDGRVLRYLFAITDTLTRDENDDWNPQLAEDRDRGVYTTKTDSVFLFNAQRGRLALHMVAIDDFGLMDRTPARAFFFTRNNGLPRVTFLDVEPFRDDGSEAGARCAGADPCTVATFTNFKLRFTGTTGNGRITGLQWRATLPLEEPQPAQPFGSDSLFLEVGTDTTAVDADGDTLWTLRGDVVTAYYYNQYPPGKSMTPGNFAFAAIVRDDSRLVSDEARRRVVVNHDPRTRLVKVAACDCPNPPPDCAGADSVAAGWITGFDRTAYADESRWVLFCDGDTLPQRAHVRFYAEGVDDERDLPRQGSMLREVGFSWRFEWCSDLPGDCIRVVRFSTEFPAQDYVLPPPLSTSRRGHRNGIGDAAILPGLCPFNYRFEASAVDEFGKRDGTPDTIAFQVGGHPRIDSLAVPTVLVLVPRCNPNLPGVCPDTTGVRFGRDTVLVVGRYDADPNSACFGLLGRNTFELPLRLFGRDDPRDRHPDILPENRGRILAWFFRLNCLDPGCDDLQIPGEGAWRNDAVQSGEPADRQVFDDPLRFSVALDTLQLSTTPCGNIRALIPTFNLGWYRFEVQGRDTAIENVVCAEPNNLGVDPPVSERSYAEKGRTTERIVRDVRLVQFRDVRPTASKPETAARPDWRVGSTARKGWLR
jgi:hypothetical protein